MGMGDGSPRPLLESSGWLAAHRRSQRWLKQNPVHFHKSSLSGEASQEPPSRQNPDWGSWSLRLFNRFAVGGGDT